MNDIKLLEKCGNCGENITLMESISVERSGLNGTSWLVKRCLKCGNYPVIEVARLHKYEDRSL